MGLILFLPSAGRSVAGRLGWEKHRRRKRRRGGGPDQALVEQVGTPRSLGNGFSSGARTASVLLVFSRLAKLASLIGACFDFDQDM
jgi:hypothetical protein